MGQQKRRRRQRARAPPLRSRRRWARCITSPTVQRPTAVWTAYGRRYVIETSTRRKLRWWRGPIRYTDLPDASFDGIEWSFGTDFEKLVYRLGDHTLAPFCNANIDVYAFAGARMYRAGTWETGGDMIDVNAYTGAAMNVLPTTASPKLTDSVEAVSWCGEPPPTQGNLTAVRYRDTFCALTCFPLWIDRENSFSRTMPGRIRHFLTVEYLEDENIKIARS